MDRAPVPNQLQRALYWAVGQLCFNRIDVAPLPSLPAGEPVLFIGLHRNGALDAVPYVKAVPNAAFLVSAQLHRSAPGRFVFPGIAVARGKDRQRGIAADNEAGIEQCITHLLSGGRLFIMPEGTSSLGPRHLPFKSGAARIALEVVRQRGALTVVPLAVHYECAWEWQSRVEVVAGPALSLTREDSDDVQKIQRRFAAALEDVGINVASAEELRLVEMLAYGGTLGTLHSYAGCLKHFENKVPDKLRADALSLQAATNASAALRHQGIPLMPLGSPAPYLLAWILVAPPVVTALVANLPPLLAGNLGGRKLADDVNVVAFWRAMVGVPVALGWCLVMCLALSLAYGWLAAVAYLGLSVVGLKLFYRFRKLSVAVFNSLLARRLKRPLMEFRRQLLHSLEHD